MIHVENLSFTYPSSGDVTLKDLNFHIDDGQIFGFLGPSGAGKSTTQKILYKVLRKFEGSVQVDGRELKNWDNSYFEKIGVGFESPNHYLKLTGKENMDLFWSFYDSNKERDLNLLFEKVGLEKEMDKPVEAYSKGMKVRLNFIRAIQHDPNILFFDEPTAGLDPGTAFLVKSYISELKTAGKTIFITTHNMETANQLCDVVAFIADGELLSIDTPNNLKTIHGNAAVEVVLKDGRSRLFKNENIGQNTAFIDYLQHNAVQNINTLDASLEEVFIKITGKKLTKA